MSYVVEWHEAAYKQLRKLDGQVRARILLAVDGLKEDPRPHGCRLLTGADALWRYRVGDYRIIYLIEDDRLIVTVVKVDHRSKVYKDRA